MRASPRQVVGLVLGAAALLSFLAVQMQSVDVQQHARYDGRLIQLKELDAQLNADVLESRFELATSYDNLVATTASLRTVQADLSTPPSFVSSEGERRLQSHLDAYRQVAEQKQGLIERFKTENAVYRNSVHYLPVLYDEIQASATADQHDAAALPEVSLIVRSVLLFNLTGDPELAKQVSTQLATLPTTSDLASATASDRRLRLFSSHVQVILDRKATLDTIAQQLVSIPTALRADDIRAEYDAQYVRALAMANGFRTALLATAAVLLGCTIYILAKWRRATDALRFQASHDALTGLANRALLQHRLAQATQSAERDGSSLALLLMDLDRFKEVNDTLGHHAGDQLLQAVAQRLGDSVRTTDTVARLGGDEFAILLPGADEQAAIAIARKLLRRLEEPCMIDGYAIDLEGSAGIAVAPAHGYEAHAMLRRADVAMYIAKASHTGYAVYAPDQDVNNTDRLGKVTELRQAIEGGQLILHYQPKLDCRTDQFSGVEALVRWQHPERGLIPPDQFIPLAEQTELIYPLTRWVLEEALRQCSAWRMRGLHLPIAINLSVRSLQDPHLPEMIADLLAAWSISPRWLTLEVTESAVMADPPKALAVLEHLRATGVRVAIDDFGTGYSSLAYLKQIPADDLKIDRSFTMSMLTDPTGQAIVRSTIELGHSLGLRVIAEGIEDEATYRALSNLNCDEGQGYYIARPLPREQLIAWLQARSHVTDVAA